MIDNFYRCFCVYSIVEVILSVPFSYDAIDEVRKLLEDFRETVNFCIDFALNNNITSYARLRREVYDEWKKRWDYLTHFCHSACKIALAILKGFRKKHKEGKPKAEKLFMQLDPQLYKFYGDKSGYQVSREIFCS